MVDHADTIPIKSVRDAVKKYGTKIDNAMDTLETYSWWGIANALTKAGVPDKYAGRKQSPIHLKSISEMPYLSYYLSYITQNS